MSERLRVALWPRRSWSRSLRYARLRFGRLDATPHAIAMGVGIGVFASFQPILGCQMLAACAVALFVRANVSAAIMGTFLGSPLTWPVMWIASYEIGAFIIGAPTGVTVAELWSVFAGPGAAASTLADGTTMSAAMFWKILRPLAVGALPLGFVCAGLAYAATLRMMLFRARRKGA